MKTSRKHLSSSSALPDGLEGDSSRFTGNMALATEGYRGREEDLALVETLKLAVPVTPPTVRPRLLRAAALMLALVLAVALYLLWQGAVPAEAPLESVPSPGGTAAALTPASAGGRGPAMTATAAVAPALTPLTSATSIEVYIVGAVRHPGVYRLPTGSRVYQLLQAAGGPLPEANLVALNLAAVLHDGEEIYVTRVGEVAPPVAVDGSSPAIPSASGSAASPSTPVNINTASVDELRQQLHVSATTAQHIVNYRLQHGPYTSVDQLLQVVSRSIYDRIKDLVTV
ncbi:ComEA family DNA-binding protein [Thermogemmatispora carboxidivorans]|uniref:ComEA family DNA-binding protein n=1 Tax=Thermogemmatispora carboxidivorans TaxID=1382306 RepID=UPI00138DEC7D|nr:ComEA family DNA-binding protein [Thermogemmatispora carboxidivorans]